MYIFVTYVSTSINEPIIPHKLPEWKKLSTAINPANCRTMYVYFIYDIVVNKETKYVDYIRPITGPIFP